MDTFRILLFLGFIFIADASKWGYVGDDGPNHWQELFPHACAGRSQSPINIQTENTVYNSDLKDFVIWAYPPSPGSRFTVINNGHAVQVNVQGDFYVANAGLPGRYTTAQFHFHWGHANHHGSEHKINGKALPLEMHIVNYNSDKHGSIGAAAVAPQGLAVLGILFEISPIDNPVFESLLNVFYKIRDPDVGAQAVIRAVSMRTFLPNDPHKYYRYNGSLTTPGCFESVIWTLFHEKQTISHRQLQLFRQVLKPKRHHGHRSRRSAQERGKEAVFEELGIQDNPEQKTIMEREMVERAYEEMRERNPQLGEMREAEEGEKKSTIPSSGHHGNGHSGRVVPYKTNGQRNSSEVKVDSVEKELEIIQDILVNNYRPVQPLNGRTVYRSFLSFEDPPQPGPVQRQPAQPAVAEVRCIVESNGATHISSSLIFIFSTLLYVLLN